MHFEASIERKKLERARFAGHLISHNRFMRQPETEPPAERCACHFSNANDRIRPISNVPFAPQPATPCGIAGRNLS